MADTSISIIGYTVLKIYNKNICNNSTNKEVPDKQVQIIANKDKWENALIILENNLNKLPDDKYRVVKKSKGVYFIYDNQKYGSLMTLGMKKHRSEELLFSYHIEEVPNIPPNDDI